MNFFFLFFIDSTRLISLVDMARFTARCSGSWLDRDRRGGGGLGGGDIPRRGEQVVVRSTHWRRRGRRMAGRGETGGGAGRGADAALNSSLRFLRIELGLSSSVQNLSNSKRRQKAAKKNVLDSSHRGR